MITPDAFAVAPELIGLPLARPWRRASAFLADLIPVGILANAGFVVFLAFATAVFAWRSLSGGAGRRGASSPIRIGASLVAFILVLRVGGVFDRNDRGNGADGDAAAADSVVQVVQEALNAAGINVTITDDEPRRVPAEHADSVIAAFATAIVTGDSAAVDRIRTDAEAALAGPRLEQLEQLASDLRDRNRELADENRELRDEIENDSGGFTALISGLADDLGIGFGWGALYFTTLTVLGRGQTPGKRLLGVRVIRLDAKPIGWWLAFERFGSYFASLSTGLLGFAQIFWDRNRQALHDKAVETVVVRMARGDRDVIDRLNAARK